MVQAGGLGEAVLEGWSRAPWTGEAGVGDGKLLTAVHGDGAGWWSLGGSSWGDGQRLRGQDRTGWWRGWSPAPCSAW